MTKSSCCKDDKYINSIKSSMTEQSNIEHLGEFFKLFGDNTRLKIIEILMNGELCVGTIAKILDMSQSSISHQLRLLKRSRLVKSRKEGKWVFYSIDDSHVSAVFTLGLSHVTEK